MFPDDETSAARFSDEGDGAESVRWSSKMQVDLEWPGAWRSRMDQRSCRSSIGTQIPLTLLLGTFDLDFRWELEAQ